MLDDWNWTIGQVVAPFGRFGELKVRLETDFPERFAQLTEVCLRLPSGRAQIFEVGRTRIHKGQVLLKLTGIESIDDAEHWRNSEVQIPREAAVALPEGSYYASDLIGLDVLTRTGRRLGKLEKVLPYPAQDLYQVGDILIPAVRQIVLEVNIPAGRIVVDPPEGLLPDEEPEYAD